MPNVTWLEPQNMVDLLALNLLSAKNGMRIPGERRMAIVSPWLSNVELRIGPSVWHQRITVGKRERQMRLQPCLKAFLDSGWSVDLAVLAYGDGPSASGLCKPWADYETERAFLRTMRSCGARIYLCANQHAKGLVTPLAVVTGSTNYTRKGLYLQSQNTNYFPYDDPDYKSNCSQLLATFATVSPYQDVL